MKKNHEKNYEEQFAVGDGEISQDKNLVNELITIQISIILKSLLPYIKKMSCYQKRQFKKHTLARILKVSGLIR